MRAFRSCWRPCAGRGCGRRCCPTRPTRGRALYVGDSEVDVDTARNAGLAMIGVSWGFRGRAALESAGAPAVADTPAQLLELLR